MRTGQALSSDLASQAQIQALFAGNITLHLGAEAGCSAGDAKLLWHS